MPPNTILVTSSYILVYLDNKNPILMCEFHKHLKNSKTQKSSDLGK